MLRAIEKMIGQYGTPMTLVQDGAETSIRAFLQETRSRSQGNAEKAVSLLGEIPGGVHVYIGPVSPEVETGDILLCRRKKYEVRQAEMVMVGEKNAYCWGLCVEMGGDDGWGS